VRAIRVITAIALALALQTTLAQFLVGGGAALDLVLVVVVYVALTNGPVTGMLAGSAAGITQDALSIGVIGIGGLAKSVVGLVVGAIGQQFLVTAALPRLVIFLGSSVAHAVMFIGIYVLLGLGSFPSPWAGILTQALGNTAVGMIAFSIVEVFPVFVDRRRLSRRTRH
jgi:rod shape-determining protein MreD